MQADPRLQPPRIAAWLVELFASAEQAESILGDLHEEFSEVASKSGVVAACRWYWRQSVKTIFHLFGAAFRNAPWSIAGIVLFGFLLRGFSFSLSESLVVAILRTQRPYSNYHVMAYMNFLFYGFHALRHEPVNEQGVVLLFGMLAKQLGFLVEAVQKGFPRLRGQAADWSRAMAAREHRI